MNHNQKILDQIEKMDPGEYFDIDFGNYSVRINATTLLLPTRTVYKHIIILFEDGSSILSGSKVGPATVYQQLLSKMQLLYNTGVVTEVSDIQSY